jgi:hypothetical protein
MPHTGSSTRIDVLFCLVAEHVAFAPKLQHEQRLVYGKSQEPTVRCTTWVKHYSLLGADDPTVFHYMVREPRIAQDFASQKVQSVSSAGELSLECGIFPREATWHVVLIFHQHLLRYGEYARLNIKETTVHQSILSCSFGTICSLFMVYYESCSRSTMCPSGDKG